MTEEIKKYEEEAERLKSAYLQCLGILQYLKNKEEKKDKEKEKKELRMYIKTYFIQVILILD